MERVQWLLLLLCAIVVDGQISNCGVRKVSTRWLIAKGQNTTEGEWPWHVAVYHRSGIGREEYMCGGTLINTTFVLTTAACADIARHRPDTLSVHLGRHNLLVSSRNTRTIGVRQIHIHDDYDSVTVHSDIAILELRTPVMFTNYIQPICLPEAKDANFADGATRGSGTIVGWGHSDVAELSVTLQKATVPVHPYLSCLTSNRELFGSYLTRKSFCAGLINGTIPCYGDSGGGMFFESKVTHVWTIRGIISFSERSYSIGSCNTQQYFGLTDVAHFRPWIDAIVNRQPLRPTSDTVL